MLRKEDSVPLYLSIMDDIRRKIQDNIYAPGCPLPSEDALAKKYGVSRITVRRAISELSNERLLVKIHGKGTFARSSVIEQEIISLEGYTELFKKKDMDISNKILQISVQEPSTLLQERLQIGSGQSVLMIERLHRVKKRPFAIDTSYFIEEEFSKLPNLLSNDTSLYQILESEFNVIPRHADRYMRVKMITPRERELLRTENEPVFHIEKTVRDKHRKIIHYSNLITPSSLVTYHVSY